jgi:hypothetical protein
MDSEETVEVFDTYKRKTRLYYILQIISFLTVGALVICKIENVQIPHEYYTPVIVLLVFGLVTTFTNVILTGTSFVNMYEKDGEMSISTNEIVVNALKFSSGNIKEIEISANDYKGARASDGSGNRLSIIDNFNKRYSIRFVIKSKDQRNKLNEVLDQLKSKGIKIR